MHLGCPQHGEDRGIGSRCRVDCRRLAVDCGRRRRRCVRFLSGLRDRHVRAVFGDQCRGIHAELVHGAEGDLLQPHPVLGPDDFRAMRAVDHPVEFLRKLPDLRTNGLQGVRPAFARLLGRAAVRGGDSQ